jgi:hypothetical protein
MLSFNIPDYSQVKKVKGSTYCDCLCRLIFSKTDGTQIDKVETYSGYSYGTEFVLDDGEEIIGIFG